MIKKEDCDSQAEDFSDVVALIPAYKPQQELIELVIQLKEVGISALVVDDGSGSEFDDVFKNVEKYATVKRYKTNVGKGYAIKYGIRIIKSEFQFCSYFITVDADGQHLVPDVIKVASAIKKCKGVVLGERDLSPKIPIRSKIGNEASKFTQTLTCGKFLRDNQTGLRGYSIEYADMLISVFGSKYEYEMNVLNCLLRRRIPIHSVMITTVYKNNNDSSHFRPIKDTLRIQMVILRSAWASVAALLFQLSVALMFNLVCKTNAHCAEISLLISCFAGIAFAFIVNGIAVYKPFSNVAYNNLRYLAEMIIRAIAYFAISEFFVRLCGWDITISLFLSMLICICPEYFIRKIIGNHSRKI